MARLKSDKAKADAVQLTPTANEAYSARVNKAREKTQALKGKGKPLGGAPPIPGGKMKELTMPKPDFGEDSMVQPPPPDPPPPPPKPVGGVGSAYPVNQQLASGELKKPVTVAEAKKRSKLSPSTQEAISQMSEQITEQEETEETPQAPEESTESSIQEDEDKSTLEEADKDLARNFDFGGIARARNALLSDERRKKIEDRLDPLNIADMVTKKEIVQTVPVVPNQLSFTFRTTSQSEYLFCLQYTYELPGSEAYSNEVLNTAKLVCSIMGINGAMLPSHLKEGGTEVDRKDFEKKWNHLIGFPIQLVGDMSVQAVWFNDRVNNLFDIGHLKNG